MATKKRWGWLWLALVAMLALLISGCRPSLVRDRLVLPLSSDPKTWNTYLVNDTYSAQAIGLMFASLVGSDGEGNLIPELAERWDYSDNGLSLTFTLRENLRWSDGKPLTAADVLFTFQDVLFNPKIPSSMGAILQVNGQFPKVTQLDDRRIRFTLPTTFAPFLRFVGGATILPKHVLAATLQPNAEGKPQFLETWGINTPVTELVGSGAYLLTEYSPNQRLVYRRNPNYWKAPLPNIPRLVYQIVPNLDTELLKFRSGELDVYDVPARNFSLVKRLETVGNYTVYNTGVVSSKSFVMFNLNQGRGEDGKPFVDPIKARWLAQREFRQAIAYALDRPNMINSYYAGLGQPQDSPIAEISPYYLSREEGLPYYDYDPAKAKQLLQQAGFRYNAAGQLEDSAGNRVRLTLATSTGGAGPALMPQIIRDLGAIGIQIDPQILEFSTLIDKLDGTRQWELAMLGFGAGVEPHASYHLWASDGPVHMFNLGPAPGQPPIPGRVVSDWEKRVDALLQQAAGTIDEAERKRLYGEFQKVIQTELPVIHLVTRLALTAIRNRVEGVQPTVLSPLWNLDELRLAE
ncbi:MAG: ABC transporter substrate-binding protein [Pseudanabaenaceae cyanobacterium]